MNKKEIAAFFDRMAPEWDANMIKSDEKINFILDAAGVKENSVVLDVACGTGVMFPYYLARGADRVIGVDISAQMARIAASTSMAAVQAGSVSSTSTNAPSTISTTACPPWPLCSSSC